MNDTPRTSQASYNADSFVLPRYRGRRRHIVKKKRKVMPTKAEMDAFTAGAEAEASRAPPSSSGSETDLSTAGLKPASEAGASQVSYDADSFVLPRYQGKRRRIVNKKLMKPTQAKIDAFTAGAEAILASDAPLSTSESETNVYTARLKPQSKVGSSQASYDADSFILPTYQSRRRHVGKKVRKKPTKTAIDAFTAGAEAMLAAGKPPSTSDSDTDVSELKHRLTSEGSSGTDSFVLPRYNAGRRIQNKKRRAPRSDEVRVFMKAVDDNNDGDWMTDDESSTDSRSKPSSLKSLSSEANAVIKTSRSQKVPSDLDDENRFAQPSNLELSRSSLPAAKQRLPKNTVDHNVHRSLTSEPSGDEQTARDQLADPNYLDEQSEQNSFRSSSMNKMMAKDAAAVSMSNLRQFRNVIGQEIIDSPKGYENHGFSPKLSSTRMSLRRSLIFEEEFSAKPARQSVTKGEDLEEDPSSHINKRSKQSPSIHELVKEAIKRSDQSVGRDFNVRNSPRNNSFQPTGAYHRLSNLSSQNNKSKSLHQSTRLEISPRRPLSFQEEFSAKPASSRNENSTHSSIKENEFIEDPASSSRRAQTSARSKQSPFVRKKVEASVEGGYPSVRSKLNVGNSSRTNSKSLHRSSLLETSSRRPLSFQEEFSAKPASKRNEHSRVSSMEENELEEDAASSSQQAHTSKWSKQSPSVREQIEEPMEKVDPSIRSKLNVSNSSGKNSKSLHQSSHLALNPRRSLSFQEESSQNERPRRSDTKSDTQSKQSPSVRKQVEELMKEGDHSVRSKLNVGNLSWKNSKGMHRPSLSETNFRSSLSFQKELAAKPASSRNDHARQSGTEENDFDEDSASSSRQAQTSTRSKQSPSVHKQVEGAMEQDDPGVRTKLNVSNSSRKNSKSLHRSSLLETSSRRLLSFQEELSGKPATSQIDHSKKSGTEENDFDEDPASSNRQAQTSTLAKQTPSVHKQVEAAMEQDDLSVRTKLNVSNSSRKNSKSLHRSSLLETSSRRLLSFQEELSGKPATSQIDHSRKSNKEEYAFEKDPYSSRRHSSSSSAHSSTHSRQSPSVREPIVEAMEQRDHSALNELNVENSLRRDSAQSPRKADQMQEATLPSGASRDSLTPYLQTNKHNESNHASNSKTHSHSFQEKFSSKNASSRSERSKSSGTENNDSAEDPASLSPRNLQPRSVEARVHSRQPSPVHEQVKHTSIENDLTIPNKFNDSSSHVTPKHSEASQYLPAQSPKNNHGVFQDVSTRDLDKSKKKSLTQSRLVFSPRNSGKLRFSVASHSLPSVLKSVDSDVDNSERSGRDLDSLNKKSNTSKYVRSRRDNSEEDKDREGGFRVRKRASQPASESESEITYSNKETRVPRKTKKVTKRQGGQSAKKAPADEEFVPLSATKANFEHFLQKRVMKPTAIEVHKQVNNFFRMVRDELEEKLARKPAKKKYISPTEAKNMFIELGLFKSLDELEMNARQWLDSDAQELVINYQGAFRNIKYD